MIGGGEVMEVMMTGDGSAMTEENLAQVVNMLQTEGQLTGGNHTIIIRQTDSEEIQMIQTTSNGGELVVTKASAEDIQALQAANVSQDMLEGQQGEQVVMMDASGNLVEGMVQMQDGEGMVQLQDDESQQAVVNNAVHMNENGHLPTDENSAIVSVSKSSAQPNEILDGFVPMATVDGQNILPPDLQPPDPPPSSKLQSPISISTTVNVKKPVAPPSNKVVSIKINTGIDKKREARNSLPEPKDIIKISTITGRQKSQPPKFHKCESCTINFVSKVAYQNHMENCPSKKKPVIPTQTKGNVTYTCVFCETKFNSRLVLMQHVRNCDKAKATKSQSVSKPKATTTESKLKVLGGSLGKNSRNATPLKNKNQFKSASKKLAAASLFDEDDPAPKDLLDSEDEDDKDIPFDDESDLNDDLMDEDDGLEDAMSQNNNSQKHLGPILTRGTFKCRDCSRTFSKENQYNRHLKGCTNVPLNSSKSISNDLSESRTQSNTDENEPHMFGIKRKRGRPSKDQFSDSSSPKKKKIDMPKIVSIDPKKVAASISRKSKAEFMSDEESDYLSSSSFLQNDDEDSLSHLKKKTSKVGFDASTKSNKSTGALSKIVKISPSDTLIKKTGKAILSKMNQQKSKMSRDNSFYCGLCGDKFKAIAELATHTQACHSEDVLNTRDLLDGKGSLSSVKCPLCDFNFVSSQMLLFHMVSYHSKELKNVSEELETLNLNLLCPFCNLTCPSQELFKEHLATNHLEKVSNKPTVSIPINIDIHSFIKEKNNGSILPTAKLLSKQEKVLCPDCGLFLLKSYFEHHRCAAESYSPSSRKFVCSEVQCAGMTFYKLIHLLTHLQQVHEKSLSTQTQSFESMTQFIEWLKKEEVKSKNKFTKALQRMKQGKLTSVWICHRFHSSFRDSSQSLKEESKKIDRLRQCYSRIQAETSFNASTSRYDGKTTIKYYSEHKHVDNTPLSPKKAPPVPPKVDPAPKPQQKAEFNDAEELKQLLDDEGENIQKEAASGEDTPQKPSENEFEEASSSSQENEKQLKFTQGENTPLDKEEGLVNESVENLKQQFGEENSSATDVSDLETTTQKEKSVVSETIKGKKEPDLASLSDAELTGELLLEKMLEEHDATNIDENSETSLAASNSKDSAPSIDDKMSEEKDDQENTSPVVEQEAPPSSTTENSQEELASGKSQDASDSPTEQKSVPLSSGTDQPQNALSSDVDMLEEAFGVNTKDSLGTSIAPEENSSTSTASTTQQSSTSSDKEDSKESKDSKMETEEENTYVLPDGIEEWKKLFELLHSQVDSEFLSKEELTKAKELLTYENQIMDIPLVKQVEVFNRLCSIANVQMT